MAIKQLSVFAENKPGALVGITGVLSDAGVDLRAMSMADTQDYGVLRLIVSDLDSALTALKAAGYVTAVNHVIAVEIPDVPGGLDKAVKNLFDQGIDVEYLYAFITASRESAYVVLRVTDTPAAEIVLHSGGYAIVTEEMIQKL